MENEEKRRQEQASLLRVNDSFKKIIITGEECLVHRNEHGFTTMSIYDFLLNSLAYSLTTYPFRLLAVNGNPLLLFQL